MLLGILFGFVLGIFAGSLFSFLLFLKQIAAGNEKSLLKIGAFICSICLFCRYNRFKPDSGLKDVSSVIEKACPFCLAFKRLKRLDDKRDIETEPQ